MRRTELDTLKKLQDDFDTFEKTTAARRITAAKEDEKHFEKQKEIDMKFVELEQEVQRLKDAPQVR